MKRAGPKPQIHSSTVPDSSRPRLELEHPSPASNDTPTNSDPVENRWRWEPVWTATDAMPVLVMPIRRTKSALSSVENGPNTRNERPPTIDGAPADAGPPRSVFVASDDAETPSQTAATAIPQRIVTRR